MGSNRNKPLDSIRLKLLIPLLAVVGGLLVAGIYVQFFLQQQNMEDRFKARAALIVRIASMGLSTPVWTYDTESIQKITDALFQEKEVLSCRLVDDQGNILLSKRVADHEDDRLLVISDQIRKGNTTIANVLVEFSKAPMQAVFIKTLTRAIVSLIILLSAISITIILIVSRVLKPVKMLVSMIDDLSAEKPPRQQQIALGNDEIGYVFKRFVEMANTLYQKNMAVHKLAYNDVLTGLPNRLAIYNELEKLLLEKSENSYFSLYIIDIDRFKIINDTFGYRTGDSILMEVASRIQHFGEINAVKVGRLGDDEFVLIKQEENGIQPEFGQHINAELGRTYLQDGLKHNLTVSIGISHFPDHGTTIEDLMRSADTAMLAVKASGKAGSRVFSKEMGDHLRHTSHMEFLLHSALDNGEFKLVFQPQFCLNKTKVDSFEALLRWHNPHYGLVQPIDFIPLLEKSGLIVSVGEWVLASAFDFVDELQSQGYTDIQIAVNVSPVQVMDAGFLDRIKRIISVRNRDPHSIILEITESTYIQNLQEVQLCILTLQELGFSLSLDDFGTGYSSLSYLRGLPFNELKVDKSFLASITEDKATKGILKALVGLAVELDLSVVVEGVETQEQWDFIATCGCQKIQGYLLSHPIPPEKVLPFLLAPPAFTQKSITGSINPKDRQT